jgi:epoxyqueuosine reductase
MSGIALSDWIRERAAALGFDLCGVVEARAFPELARAEEWLARGYAGEMNYLADPRRADPAAVMPGVRSVIVCALNYNTGLPRSIDVSAQTSTLVRSQKPTTESTGENAPEQGVPRGWISRYAWGTDYHLVLTEKLEALLGELRQRSAEAFDARVYTDTGPLHERVLAKYAGLGWVGKNTLLLNQRLGSYFFLGTILTTLEIAPTLGAASGPAADLCGTCRRCIEACPTEALIEPYVMDARRCISYLTIELRGRVPHEFRPLIGNHVFGCDICQDVCPWNNRAPIAQNWEFQPRRSAADRGNHSAATPNASEAPLRPVGGVSDPASPNEHEHSLYLPKLLWLAGISEEEFRTFFRGSPIKRTKWCGIVRNACIALGNTRLRPGTAGYGEATALLRKLAGSCQPVIAESAQWALARIQHWELNRGELNRASGNELPCGRPVAKDGG